PVLASYWLKSSKIHSSGEDQHRMLGVDRFYRNLLGWSLNHRRFVVGLAVLSFAAGIALIPLIPKGFIPKLDRGEFNIVYNSPLSPDRPNPLNDSLLVAQRLENVVRTTGVESVFTVVGSREGEPNKGTLYVKLKRDRQIKTAEFEDKLRLALPNLPGVTTSVEDIQFVDTGGQKPLQLALKGNDPQALSKAASAIKARLDKLPGFADVTVTGEANAEGTVFEIERQNNLRVAYITANLGKNLSLGSATDQVKALVKTVLPPGVTLKLGGDSARIDEILKTFAPTIGLSVLCIMVVLFWLFRSWIDPIVIGLSLPLGLVGAMLALLVTGSEFGMISLIGFIFLLGLSNKNAILLVDYINKLRASGLSRTEAILKAAPVRLRPIIMTTAATILGMVPIALGLGAGSELRSPMAVAIAGGLVTSTILSLLVVPVVYALLDDWFPRGKRGIG
ncbi:MAG: efflux RND transporter permease subunit, partial [Nostocaceae cyanobacterium]|nr:efflux RND transporter permease subunit [Nostocaceae cyanobacterium]